MGHLSRLMIRRVRTQFFRLTDQTVTESDARQLVQLYGLLCMTFTYRRQAYRLERIRKLGRVRSKVYSKETSRTSLALSKPSLESTYTNLVEPSTAARTPSDTLLSETHRCGNSFSFAYSESILISRPLKSIDPRSSVSRRKMRRALKI